MKNYTLFAAFYLLIVCQATAQEKLLMKANFITGQGAQAGKLKNAIGLGLQYQRSIKNTPFEYMVTGESHLNGVKTMPYELNFGNSRTNTDVKYVSTISKIMAGGAYVPLQRSLLTPFVSLQAGALWYHTTVQIEDPRDSDGCKPVQSKTVKLSVIAIGQIETGMRVYFKKKGAERSFIQAGAAYTFGSRGSYIRLSNKEHNHAGGNGEYMAKFRNNAGEEHEHSLGKIYRTNTNQIVYSIGFGLTL